MKAKMIVVSLALGMAAFLTSGCDSGKIKQLDTENARLKQVIQQKDAKINTMTTQMQAKEKEAEAVKKEVDTAKKEADSVKKEMEGIKAASENLRRELDNSKRELDTVRKELEGLKVVKPAAKK